MTGQSLNVKNTEFQFGDFVQAKVPKTNTTGNSMDERVSDAIYCRPSRNIQGGFWVYKLSMAQVVHRNKAKLARSSDAIATQVKRIAEEEGMPLGISFGNRDNGTTILDFEIDANDNDGISVEEYSDNDSQAHNDHNLSDDEYVTAKEDNIKSSDNESDDNDEDDDDDNDDDAYDDDAYDNKNDNNGDINQFDIDDDDTNDDSIAWEDKDDNHNIQGAHFDNDEQSNVGVASDDDLHENVGVPGRRSSRDHQEPKRFVAEPASRRMNRGVVFTQMRVVFLQAVDRYQKIEASMSTKQYAMTAGLKIFGANGYDALASEI